MGSTIYLSVKVSVATVEQKRDFIFWTCNDGLQKGLINVSTKATRTKEFNMMNSMIFLSQSENSPFVSNGVINPRNRKAFLGGFDFYQNLLSNEILDQVDELFFGF